MPGNICIVSNVIVGQYELKMYKCYKDIIHLRGSPLDVIDVRESVVKLIHVIAAPHAGTTRMMFVYEGR